MTVIWGWVPSPSSKTVHAVRDTKDHTSYFYCGKKATHIATDRTDLAKCRTCCEKLGIA